MSESEPKSTWWPQPQSRVGPLAEVPLSSAVPAVVAIGASTGGPTALESLLPCLPVDLPASVLIVQHMPVGFTGPLTERLNTISKIKVTEAREGTVLQCGHAYIATAGQHMTVYRRSSAEVVIHVSTAPQLVHMPSVDIMMKSVAEIFRNRAMGIILTGMGDDGAQGMEAIYSAGGMTIGQDEASCAVYGMPHRCAEMGVLRHVVSLPLIPFEILTTLQYYKTQ
jgi:two-component system, chemotaxis family, protein-glutamate methylesterase/glutaminase